MRSAVSYRFFAGLLFLGALEAAPPVTVREDALSFTLANDLLSARIEKRTGNLTALLYEGHDLLRGGRGYWSQVGNGTRLGSKASAVVRLDPAQNSGDRAEVACRLAYDGQPGTLPVDVEMRYALGRGEHWLYASARWDHRPGYPALSVGEARYALKLNPKIFDFLTIDAQRRRVMPTGADWDAGETLNLKEVRRLTTGRYAGQVEHKYGYSAVLSETPAYGWSSTAARVGLWVVNPSGEYLSGGPTKVELTGHLDVNPGGAPTLLNMWLGSHYGGSLFAIAPEEDWTKVIGPFLLYANSGGDHEALWRDALDRAEKERAAWPYAWVQDAAYPPAAARGTVRGQLVLDDGPEAKMSHVQVGLTAPDYEVRGRRGARIVDWQRDAKFYQHWTRADAAGRFTIAHARPGTYTLRAIAEGVLGEFARADVVVKAGETLELGPLTWKPVRYGRTLWEIGVADRTAAEFRHGEHYWQWGLYLKYAEEFPDDVRFVIGKSDPRRDWNYAQPPRLDARGRVLRPSTWRILFTLPEAPRGKATLRLAIAGSRTERGIEVRVNDAPALNTGPLPDTGVMHRDGIRGAWCERAITFDGAHLRAGENIIALTVPATSWPQGVLYDYLRLELE
jgi:rhamnogalacturonan endolyase